MTTPTSALSLAAAKLARMVALSATFQAETGGTAASAARRVFRRAVSDPQPRPLAIVSHGENHSGRLVAGGAQNWLRESASLYLDLARDVPVEHQSDELAAEEDAVNWFGNVITDVHALANQDDADSVDGTSHLAIVRFDRLGFAQTDQQDWHSLGRYYFARYELFWGDGDQ